MIKLFKKEKSFKKERLHRSPSFFWKLAILVIFVVFIFSYFFGYYLFIQINKEPLLETSSISSQVETVKKERIDKVLEYFSNREQKSNQILNSSAPIIDPSL